MFCIPLSPWWERQSHPEHGEDADSEPDPDLGTLISLSGGDLRAEESQKVSAGAQVSGTRHSQGDQGQLDLLQGRAAGMIRGPTNMTSMEGRKELGLFSLEGRRVRVCKRGLGKRGGEPAVPGAHCRQNIGTQIQEWDICVGREEKVGPGEGWNWSQEGEKWTKRPEKPYFLFYFFS